MIVSRFKREWRVATTRLTLIRHGVVAGRRPSSVGQTPYLVNEGEIRIGDRVVFGGEGARALLRAVDGGLISVGDGVLINSGASIQAVQRVTIGNNVRIGPRSSISDTQFHEVVPGEGVQVAPVEIGDDVWISQGVVIFPGITIGDGAVIGANSVVTKSVPPFTLSVGSPARTVRNLPHLRGRR